MDGGFEPDAFFEPFRSRQRLPWDHIDIGLEEKFLEREYRKALKSRLFRRGKPFKQMVHYTNVADAEAGAQKKLVCYDCGVACDLQEMKDERLYYLRRMNAWEPQPAPPPPSLNRAKAVSPGKMGKVPMPRGHMAGFGMDTACGSVRRGP